MKDVDSKQSAIEPLARSAGSAFCKWWNETGQDIPQNNLDMARDAWDAAIDYAVEWSKRLDPPNSDSCDCGGSPHGAHCAAVEAGIETAEWQCPECGQHAGNCPHSQPNDQGQVTAL